MSDFNTEDYKDSRFCDNCKDYTSHICNDDGHERDTSWDYQECSICHWYKFGINKDYKPPVKI